jgi:hypothetical protein
MNPLRTGSISGAVALLGMLGTVGSARAQELPKVPAPADIGAPALKLRRYEFLPIPNVGGNSDVGVQVGVSFTLAHFYDQDYPYEWLLSGLVSASFKDGTEGFRAVEQAHSLTLDLADLFDKKARLITTVGFVRQVDARYYGVGDASVVGGGPPGSGGTNSRYDEYTSQNAGLRSFVRIRTGTPVEPAFALAFRWQDPTAYTPSRLAEDAPRGVAGLEQTFLSTAAGGFIIDTRDDEFVPHRGVYDQVGVAGTVGTAEKVAYGEASANFSSFLPLGRKITFATRVITSFEVGRAPFYDLQQGNVFDPEYLVGGVDGVRGIRLGRYAGRVKVISNYELRTMLFPALPIFSWRVNIGTTTFFDAGRVWSDYDTSQLDGQGLGIKYGAGGGLFFQLNKSSVFRVEVAYSPDGKADGTPVSFYLANGLIF